MFARGRRKLKCFQQHGRGKKYWAGGSRRKENIINCRRQRQGKKNKSCTERERVKKKYVSRGNRGSCRRRKKKNGKRGSDGHSSYMKTKKEFGRRHWSNKNNKKDEKVIKSTSDDKKREPRHQRETEAKASRQTHKLVSSSVPSFFASDTRRLDTEGNTDGCLPSL